MRTEDGYIVQRCLDGDSAAYGLLVDRYKKSIYALAYSKVHNFHDAQDITQEAFIKAYRNLRTLRRWDNFMGWLYRITINLSRDCLRLRARRPDNESLEEQTPETLDHPAMDSYRDDMVDETVREALDSLPEMYRQVLTLRYFGGMNIREISRFLGVSPSTIDRRFREARAQFKEEMIVMMSETYEQHQLPSSFTFRIVEMVKRIRIQTMPRSAGLPWGLSLAAGIILAVMAMGSQLSIIYERPLVRADVPRISEVSVDIFSGPQTSIIAGQGDADGKGLDPRSFQNAALLAPARGGGSWIQKADMPTTRAGSGAAAVDGKIYVLGGYINTASWNTTTVVEEYSPTTDTWIIKTDMPSTRGSVKASAVNGIIYAIGGWTPGSWFSSAVEAYDPVADKWTKKTNMPTVRDGFTASVVDGRIYIIGGHTWNNVILPTVEVYDPATDKWTKGADMPMARWTCATCVVNGQIYVFGGSLEWEWGPVLTTVEVYDPATDTWSQVSDMPWPRYNSTASALDGKIYIVGGDDPAIIDLFNAGKIEVDELEATFSIVDVYDPATDTWVTAANIPTPRSSLSAVVVDGKIYAIGGAQGNTLLSTVEEYDPGLSHGVSGVRPDGKVPTYWGQVKSDR